MDTRRTSFEYDDLLACGRGELFNEGPQLPLPPMLMFDRISDIAEAGGQYGKGKARARGARPAPRSLFFSLPLQGRSGHARLPRYRCAVADAWVLSWLAGLAR